MKINFLVKCAAVGAGVMVGHLTRRNKTAQGVLAVGMGVAMIIMDRPRTEFMTVVCYADSPLDLSSGQGVSDGQYGYDLEVKWL
jgi:hypothetical protein